MSRLSAKTIAAAATGAVLLGVGAWAVVSGPSGQGIGLFTPRETPPLVVLIIVDTLRRDSLGPYSDDAPPTPAIDAFAELSTVYTQATAPSSWTTPSVGAILTGKMPSQLGLQHELRRLSPQATMVSEYMQEQGFATAGVISNKYASTKWGFNQGYDAFDERPVKRRVHVTSDEVTDIAIDLLDRFEDQPLFLMAHYVDPHVSYNEHETHLVWTGDYDGPVVPPIHWEDLREAYRDYNEADWQRLRSVYDSEVAWTDTQVGRLIDHIGSSGRLNDALIVFTHDHGEELGDHNGIGHGYNLYEEAVGAPLIVHYPRDYEAPRVIETPVSLIDIVPTVLAVTNTEPKDDLLGLNLLGPLPEDRPILTESDRGGRPIRAVRIGEQKLIKSRPRRAPKVYNLSLDPGEQAGRRADSRDDDLVAVLEAWPENELTAEAEPIDIDAAERAMLEALGYLDGQ